MNMSNISDQSFFINKSDNNNTQFNFKYNDLILFDSNGQIILNSSNIDSQSENLIEFGYFDTYSYIIKKLIKINEISKPKKETIQYYLISNEKIKIVILNIKKTNLYLLGSFNGNIHSSIIKIFLLHILLSFLNYMGEKSSFISKDYSKSINGNGNDTIDNGKINVYSNKESINKDIISTDNNNYVEGNDNLDLLYIRIYENFLLLPIIKFFILITKNIFIRRNYYNNGAIYKNLYLVDIDTGQILFSMENLYNLHNGYHPNQNTNLNSHIWKEILYRGKMLKKEYTKNEGKILDFEDSQQYFTRIELRSTFPRMIFIIRFMPLLNGILLINEYEWKSYSNEDISDEEYKEVDILNGSSLSKDNESELDDDDDEVLLINEPKFIKEREYFFINFFLSTNSNINDIFYIKNSQIKYFSNGLLNSINQVVTKYNSDLNSNDINFEKILININNELYNEYLRINNNEDKSQIYISSNIIVYKNINNLGNEKEKDIIDLKLLDEDNYKIINQYQWNIISCPYLKYLFQINEKFILIILFNYRKDRKKNELTLNLSKFDDYSFLEKEDKKINEENIKNENKNSLINVSEKLSDLLEDKISEYIESPENKINNSYYKDKQSYIKKIKNENINKSEDNNFENNKISDEDKSKDIINIKYENEKSSLFNLDITNISKNDINLWNSFKIEKENNKKKILKFNKIKSFKSLRKNTDDNHKSKISKVNSFNNKKSELNNSTTKRKYENNESTEAKPISNLSNVHIQHYNKSFEEKDRNKLKNSKNKNFLDKYFNTIGSLDNFYNYESISNNRLNDDKNEYSNEK
jgi:hypothetical protein